MTIKILLCFFIANKRNYGYTFFNKNSYGKGRILIEGDNDMTIKECYNILGGDYENVRERFIKEELIQRFLIKFPEDDSFFALTEALAEKDMETAFRMAHTLKGLSLNIGLEKLYRAASQLVEELRSGEWKDVSTEMKQVENEYALAVSAIKELKESAVEKADGK